VGTTPFAQCVETPPSRWIRLARCAILAHLGLSATAALFSNFIPPAQYYHSSPNSTHIVSCPNPGACEGDRTALLDCKLVSAEYRTTQPASHVWPLKLCLLPCTGRMQCDTGDAHAIHPLYYTRSNVHRSHALHAHACIICPG